MQQTRRADSTASLWLAAAAVEGLLAGCSGSQSATVETVDVAPPKVAASADVIATAAPNDVRHAQGDAHAKNVVAHGSRNCCRGTNDCKARGNCKIDGVHDCKGLNECKGKGGCKSGDCGEAGVDLHPPAALPIIPIPVGSAGKASSPANCCKGLNQCKGLGECKVQGQHDCKGKNACKGLGGGKPATC